MEKNAKHPPSTRNVRFKTDAGWHDGFYLKDANKYIKNICRWKDAKDGKWYDDRNVIEWCESE